MNRLKVALLEDNKTLLDDRKSILKKSNLAEVVVSSNNSTEFIQKIKQEKPDAIMIDIDLGTDSMNGLEVANYLKLPVMFVSAFNGNNLKEIELLKYESEFPVEHITKPFSDNAFLKATEKFMKEVDEFLNAAFVYLNFKDTKKNKISTKSIAYIESETGNSGASNNKKIFFTDRKPETLYDFSFTQMKSMGFDSNIFIEIHRSYRVNVNHIDGYNSSDTVNIKVINENGKSETKQLTVSENQRKSIKSIIK